MASDQVVSGYAATATGGRLFRMGRGTVADPQGVRVAWPARLCLPESPEGRHALPAEAQCLHPECGQHQVAVLEAVTGAFERDLTLPEPEVD